MVVSVYLILCLIIIIYNAKNNTNTNNNTYNNYISTFLALLSMIIIFIFEIAAWLRYLNIIIINMPTLLVSFFIAFILIGFFMRIFLFGKDIAECIPNVITIVSMIIYIISIYVSYCCELNDEYRNNTLS